MAPAALLDLAAQLLHEVMRLQAPADAELSRFFRAHKALGPRERHTLAETAYTVLRQRLRIAHLARQGAPADAHQHLSTPRRWAALAWAGDEAFLQKALTPPERDWLAKVRQLDATSLPEKLRHNLPDWLAALLRSELPADEAFWPLVQALDQPAPLDLRVNLLKAKRDDMLAALSAEGLRAEPTPLSPWGIRLQGKPAIQHLPAFRKGLIEVQDEGSQLLALLSGAGRGEMVVDFCAGAGGKTLAMGAMMRSTGRLYAFDTSGHRLEALKPRLVRSGLQNVYAAQIAHERDERIKRLAGKIDRVLVDAPCSGLGTLRRNPDLKWRQSPQALAELQAKQAAILEAAARLLRPGGRLVYATCSLLRSENEAQAEAFDAGHGGAWQREPLADLWPQGLPWPQGLAPDAAALRVWPHLHHSDGFFAAAWRKLQ
jgi:16S rRNA (cytosine967-C5)-methyltransferase